MTRTLALTYVGGIYSQQLVEAGLTAVDTDANLKPVLDDALTILGVAYDDLATAEVTGDDIPKYRFWLMDRALNRLLVAVFHRPKISGGSPSASKDPTEHAKEIRAAIKMLHDQAQNYGVSIGPTWQAPTSINTDYLEPVVTW